MSIVTKTTWAKIDFNNRNIFPVKEETFVAAASDVINKLWEKLGDKLWSYMEYKDNGDIEISYPCFDENGKYTEKEMTWLIKEEENED